MVIASEQLIDDLKELTQKHIVAVLQLKDRAMEELTWRSSDQSWNVLECLEHLNLYGNFYLPEMAQRIKATKTRREGTFTSGLLGNYFANGMLPKAKLNKMKTFKSMNPLHRALGREVLDNFLDQLHRMLELLERARKVSLNKVKTSISISKLIKLKLGDTFRVVIYHNERHLQQAEKILAERKTSKNALTT